MIKHTDKILVVDLECTCWEFGLEPPGEKSEIIQIGWAWLDLQTLQVSGKAHLFVKPQISKISDYCTNLTGITWPKVKGGIPFEHACKWLIKNLGCRSRAWAAWGGDKRTLDEQCTSMKCEMPFSDGYLNIQQLMFVFGGMDTPRPGLEKIMQSLQIEPCGPAHRADNDAFDTATVLARMIKMYRQCTLVNSPLATNSGPQEPQVGTNDEKPPIVP